MRLHEKAKLVGDMIDAMPQANPLWVEVTDLIEDANDAYLEYDEAFGGESWGESFIRYHKVRRISGAKVNEFYYRMVLAGLHNNLEEQDDADS